MEAFSAADVQRTFASIDLEALRQNVRWLCAHYGAICGVVKADAYGHGLAPCARAILDAGATCVAVATPAEGQFLRACGITHPVHVLSPAEPSAAHLCVMQRLTPYVSSTLFLAAFIASGGKVQDAFIMLDSGMGREGLAGDTLISWAATAGISAPFLGIATHLACADTVPDTVSKDQLRQLQTDLEPLYAAGLLDASSVISINNSAGLLRGLGLALGIPNTILHRPGAIVYGITPFESTVDIPIARQNVTPVLSWRARVHLVKQLRTGSSVGYGATWTAERETTVATVGIGYADGYPRTIDQRAHVLIRGYKAPIIGVVSMDQLQIDVTDILDIAPGDWVTLIGSEGTREISVLDIARWAKVPVQWPTSALSPRVPRRYIGLT